MNDVVIARSEATKQSRAYEDGIATPRLRVGARNDVGKWLAALGGFLLPWQTIWILRPGMLGGIPWSLATIGVYASDIILFIAAVLGVIRTKCSTPGVEQPAKHLVLNTIFALALLVLVVVMNTTVSADPALSAVGWVRIILFLLAFIGIPAWSTSARRAFLGGFLLAMLGHVVLGFLQFATGHGFSSTLLGTAGHDAFVRGDSVVETASGRWLRAYGGFPHPNVFGTALLVMLIALVYLRNLSRERFQGSGGGWASVATSVMWLLGVVAVALTFSRAAWLGFVLLLIALVSRRTTRDLAICGGAVFLAVMFAFSSLIAPRFSSTMPNEARSVGERRAGTADAFVLMTDRPILGIGLHAMPSALAERAAQGPADAGTRDPYSFQPVHNVPLLAIVEVGGIGILVLLLVFVLILRHSSLLTHHSSIRSDHFLPLTSYLLPFLPSLLFDHHLWSLAVGPALLFVLVVVMSMQLDTRPVVRYASPQ